MIHPHRVIDLPISHSGAYIRHLLLLTIIDERIMSSTQGRARMFSERTFSPVPNGVLGEWIAAAAHGGRRRAQDLSTDSVGGAS